MKMDGKRLLSIILVTMLVASIGIVVVQGSPNDGTISELSESENSSVVLESEPEDEDETEMEDEDEDHVDDDFEDLNEREVQVELEENQIQIESVLKNGENQDKIELKLEYDEEGLGIKLSYENEYDAADSGIEIEHELSIKIEFRKIIEYIDTDMDGIFNDSIDQEVQEYDLNDFGTPTYTTIAIDENSTLHYLNISTSDGVFTAHVYVAEEFTEINTILITPTQTKIDIEIKDFNYIEVDSQLALYTKLESEEEFEEESETDDEEQGYKHNESGIETIQNGFVGFFTWAETATVDGMEKDVLVSPVENDDDEINEKVYINYPRGNSIYHDPTLGIANILISPTTSNLLLPILIGVSAALGIAVVAGLLIKAKVKRN